MTELQGIMTGIGLPYELGTGDMSQVFLVAGRRPISLSAIKAHSIEVLTVHFRHAIIIIV